MRFLILFSLIFFTQGGPSIDLSDTAQVVPQEAIDYINAIQNSWIASNIWVQNMTIKQAKTYTSSSNPDTNYPEKNWGNLLNYFTAPLSFDSRIQWPTCIHPIRDQGKCGSCWAFAASEALSDRLCIAGGPNIVLSPQWLIDCDTQSSGCNGGVSIKAWQFMMSTGIVADSCVPYIGVDSLCPSICTGSGGSTRYYATSAYMFTNPTSIQAEIISSGPIGATFTVYQDFMSYKSGVYVHTWGNVVGGHAVKMLGWGVLGTQNYWICANSWGTNWGMQGFFYIAFGQCGIDSSCTGGNAKV
ncbi:hypothetical protein SteCoe_36251 [Stentor coeruleus]|uniref:Peptidase C1A papain C-terminal domain-containing protein n=1 Tax=Stentor coeruleus TaxID=5963 RepID=A0A1R2AQM9_9CILI|nr:hypothetical protein SteCoe_36251 [Stentor coeruleus]